MTYHLLIATTLSDQALQSLQQNADLQLQLTKPNRSALEPYLATADALIIGEEMEVDTDLIAAAPHLKIIGRAGASITRIDLEAATRRGIMVMNTPGIDSVTVAEYTFAVMLALTRNLIGAYTDLRDGSFNREAHIGTQLQGKTLGIFGFGRVGRAVAARALAFEMNVLATDPYVGESAIGDMKVKLVGWDELLARSDILTLHVPAVPQTCRILDAEAIARMKPGAFIINIKDANLVDEAALLEALNRQHIAGAAVDVLPDTAQSSLLRHPRVIHTLRMRDNTLKARQDFSVLIANQVVDALRGDDYRNAVNMPFAPGQEYREIAPYLELAERAGFVLYHLGHPAPIKRISVEVSGDEMHALVKPLTVAFLKGLLAPTLDGKVNYINAPVLAAEQGIHLTQTKALRIHTYANLLTCQVIWEDGFELIVSGALFNETEPRIVQLDQYRTDFTPAGVLLIMGSYDVPGVIGRVGSFMAEHGINIASWRTSRAEKGGHTLSIIVIDEPLENSLLDTLRQKEFVRHITQIIFDSKDMV